MVETIEEYLVVEIQKKCFAINTRYIESIHPSASIKFNEDRSHCLQIPETNWEKSCPIFKYKISSGNANKLDIFSHYSRVIFFSDDQTGKDGAIIVDAIRKVSEISVEKENKIERNCFDSNEEVIIFDIGNVFMT